MLLIGPPILRECIPSPSSPPIKQNPCTQFFFAVNPENVPENLTILLEKSWQYDPLTTLRLIAYLRSLSGGKGFYISALWLYKTHPLTLSCNLREFASFGSLRVFADILYSIVVNEEDTIIKGDSEIARRAVSKYVEDSTYRFYHDRVSDLFADLLKSDIQSLHFGNLDLLSYASVDCPSIDSSIDRNTLLCESIAKKVFPKEDSDPCYLDIQDDHYVYRVRNRLKKEVITPLRSALQDKSPRQLQNDCTLVLMKKAYQKLLKMKMNHQDQTQLKYYRIVLSMILKGNTKVFPATPLSVVSCLKSSEEKELEWKDMVKKFCKQEKLANCVVVCDVSDDMSETAKNISASMGLMISELSSGPWKESVYGFNQSPEAHKIKGDDLGTKLNFIKQLICTKKVDIEAILNEILEVSIRMPENTRVERVFVFSNKEFRKGVNHSWGWNYRRVWEKYEKSGFNRVPQVVFWNIQGMNYSPPASRSVFHNRLMLINGFSTSLFAFLLNEDALWRSDEIKSVTTAQDVIKITLSGKQYQNFVVLD